MGAIEFRFPSIKGVDKKLTAEVMEISARALLMATQQGWVTTESASKAYIDLAGQYGIELKEPTSQEMQDETGAKEYKDALGIFDQIKHELDKNGHATPKVEMPA